MHWIEQSKRQFAKITRRGVDLLYPPQCACCREELDAAEPEVDLCAECQKRLIPKVWIPCPRCGGPIEGPVSPKEGCASCRETAFHFDAVAAVGDYHTELRHVIARMKIEYGASLALAMGKLLAAERREMLKNLQPDLVLPIPMHWMHRIRRRVNNPELIARSVATALEISSRRGWLVRCKKTLTQSDLPPRQRFLNVRGAFRVRHARKIQGRRIILVDDVLTTGATCSEAAKVLKQAGAAMVAVAVIARARGTHR
jgi:ComF family protein